jgi:hypothetical protein
MTAIKTSSKSRPATRQESTENAVTTQNQRRKPAQISKPTTEFGNTLKDLLGKTFQPGKINEEELFAATTHQLILNRYGAAIAQDFKSAFKLNMADKPPSERFASAERATKESLQFFVNSTLITKEEAKEIRQLAFATAQLDDNVDVAWDSMGDTKAVTSFAKGEKLIQARLEASGNAPITLSRRSRDKTSTVAGYGSASAPKAKRPSGKLKQSA